MMEASSPTARMRESPWRLLVHAAGTPSELVAKMGRFVAALGAYANGRELDARLRRLREIGYLDEVPSRLQLVVGAADMLRFWIVPASEDYYRDKGIDFTFHQVLRFLDEPASLVDPTGFLSTRDNIIGHVMQVVHANPCYDLQLLEAHEHGLEELESQIVAMLDGTHPRARSIGAIVEEPGYHARLLEYVREYRRTRDAQAPLRDNVSASPRFRKIERTFGTLPSAMRYFTKLPRTLPGAMHHLRTVKTFPEALGAA